VEVEQVAICAHIGWGGVGGRSSVQIQLPAVQAKVTLTSERTTTPYRWGKEAIQSAI
jgi:hypothetical protein